ncbi:glycoside hydrolase family 3 N-terminal domain-containing protein [Leucobacter sp. UT-8R-CII-1-4]|uniref:glycoside hydrolase family 3 protein n=1 Tax=Leucobacter sp. UT-8R-CII-1-4 TaxID=3040075 RepID=UPI0024A7AA5A|nr:glycoside hydrolase family 3 N-terminal domain-containing protein [Leucobacter sp. UT-8R-CII-1-4]MDI6022554.1 glycoside hydrolase family 3 N-terminal domain-containing protein [Leucobacter sp. UT-8R-CII-1-4]
MTLDRIALRRDLLATLMPGFAGYGMPDWVPEAFTNGMRSVCIYGENVRDAEQLHALGAQLRAVYPQALIAIDEEGGEVTRLHYLEGSPYPGAAVLGRIDDTDYTELIGERVGHDILGAGFNLALGPIADVNSNPKNPVIGTRSFAAEPELAGRHVAAWVRGLQRTGAIACAKHFPGHGDTAQDSHLALPSVDAPIEVLEQRELPPFRSAVLAEVSAVMTSHILLPQIDSVPATFSRKVLQGLLRDELEFEGIIISDALDMAGASGETGIPEAAVRALIAGCDLLCLGTGSDPAQLRAIEEAVVAAVEHGRLTLDRLSEAAERVRAVTAQPLPSRESAANAAGDPTLSELDRISKSFAGVEQSTAWLREHPAALVLRVDSEANMAVGEAPWGPFAAEATPITGTRWQASAFAKRERLDVGGLPHEARRSDGVIVIGRDLHRLPHGRAAIESLRSAGVPTLSIEMGWPDVTEHNGYADLSCYGSSRLVGAALLRLIEGESE